MSVPVHCVVCGAAVADPRAHIRDALHDRFEVRLPNGTRVALGDMGADRAVVEEEKAQRVTAQREDDERWRETLANDAALLAGARSSVEEYRQAIVRLGAEMVSLTDAIAAVDGEVPAAEQAHRDAQAAIEATRAQVRRELAEWWPAGKTIQGVNGQQLTADESLFEAYVADNDLVHRAESAASDAGQGVSRLSYERTQLVRSLTTLAEHKAQLEADLPARQAYLELQERVDWMNRAEDVNRPLRRLAALKLPVEGAALRKARGEALVRKHLTEGK